MQIITTERIPGKEQYRILGLVTGNSIRAKHIGKDIMAGLKQLVGGELKGYTEMMNEARDQAMSRMIDQATEMGANAIIGVRFASTDLMASAAEVLCYGTAVQI